MQSFIDNYLYILGIGLFLLFALIGYLVETIKNNNGNKENIENIENEITEDIIDKDIVEEKIVGVQDDVSENVVVEQGDVLLDEYDHNIQ